MKELLNEKNKKINSFNKKVLIISIVLTSMTYHYFDSKEHSSIVSGDVFIGLAILTLCSFVIYFSIIKMIGYFIIKEKIYPNTFFRIALPFVTILLISFVIFGIFMFEPFNFMKEFNKILIIFFKVLSPYVIILTTITGIFLKMPDSININNKILLWRNIYILILLNVLFIASIFFFYYINKIEQSVAFPY